MRYDDRDRRGVVVTRVELARRRLAAAVEGYVTAPAWRVETSTSVDMTAEALAARRRQQALFAAVVDGLTALRDAVLGDGTSDA